MKSFVIFVFFLSTLVFLSRAQDPNSCESEFKLPAGQQCTPCQQSLHKYNIESSNSTNPDKCLISDVFSNNVKQIIPTSVTDLPNSANPTQVFDKTCSDTSQCTEPYVKGAYTEVDKSCTAELTQHQSGNTSSIGSRAEKTITTYYLALPLRGFFCNKEGLDCLSPSALSTMVSGLTGGNIDNLGCNDCTKKLLGRYEGFKETHPLDTPTLQNITLFKKLNDFEKTCPIPKDDLKSNGHKLIIGNFKMILIGIMGFTFLNFL